MASPELAELRGKIADVRRKMSELLAQYRLAESELDTLTEQFKQTKAKQSTDPTSPTEDTPIDLGAALNKMAMAANVEIGDIFSDYAMFSIINPQEIPGVPEAIKKLNGKQLDFIYGYSGNVTIERSTRDYQGMTEVEISDGDWEIHGDLMKKYNMTSEEVDELIKFFTHEKIEEIRPNFFSELEEAVEEYLIDEAENPDYPDPF